MPTSGNKAKRKVQSKLEVIKKINDDPKNFVEDLDDLYLKDLPSMDFGKKFGDLLSKTKKKKDNSNNIFKDLVEIAEGFFGSSKRKTDSDKLFSKSRIKQHAIDSAKVALNSSKQIILDRAKKIFFSSDGICGTNGSIKIDAITLSPSEYDFLNTLTVDPTSTVGQIVYEPTSPDKGKLKANRKIFESFTAAPFQFDTLNNNTLFTMTWGGAGQYHDVTGLLQGKPVGSVRVQDFFNDYYSTIEMPDMGEVLKNAMLLTLQGGDGGGGSFQKGINNLNRLLSKLFSICGSPGNGDNFDGKRIQKQQDLKQNTDTEFNENDEDEESYFDFDGVDGIDLEEEDARLRRVLIFADCNNFEIPVDNSHIDDFAYLCHKISNGNGNGKSLNDAVNSALSSVASKSYNSSDQTIPIINFNTSLMSNFILNLPKALMMSVVSPKMFLPIVMIYKIFKSGASTKLDVKEIMRKLSKLFLSIIKDLFWKFIREFWKRIKADLLRFVSRLAIKIIKNKLKRYLTIITSILSFLKQLLQEKINNCYALFNIIITTVTQALKGRGSRKIPSILYSFASMSAGYSQDRAYMNICERLQKAGVPLGPLYGDSNHLTSLVKSIIDGHTEEEDNNGYIAGGNTFFTVPVPGAGPALFPPGIINIFGKKR
jgi:hypothetical protein